MGLLVDRDHFEEAEYEHFAHRLQANLHALRELLQRPGFGRGPVTLGAELEVSIIDETYRALPVNREVLARTVGKQVQLELDRFNLELNLEPVAAAGAPFSALQSQLEEGLHALNEATGPLGGQIVPIGILPTLSSEDLQSDALTDLPRYRALANGVRRLRQRPFEIKIHGEEPLEISGESVTLEGANTSFQVHLRVDPEDFADTFNAVQLTTPLALAVAANSPIYLGRCLWDETRVALFKQALDSRLPHPVDWRRAARVPFGHGWLRRSALELFAESVALHPPIIPVVSEEDPLVGAGNGGLPSLQELRLHQGTVWQWNRAIYDPGAGGHLRIEMRALPGGPTPLDMAANAAFHVGLSMGLRERVDALLPSFPFKYAEFNFYRAAQHGLSASLLWPAESGNSPREVGVLELCRELMPRAEAGLRALGVERGEVGKLLGVIGDRLRRKVSPARWQRRTLEALDGKMSRPDALRLLLERYVEHAGTGAPVSTWPDHH